MKQHFPRSLNSVFREKALIMLEIIHGQSTKGEEEKQGNLGAGEGRHEGWLWSRSAEKAGVRSGHSREQTPWEGGTGVACLGTTDTP